MVEQAITSSRGEGEWNSWGPGCTCLGRGGRGCKLLIELRRGWYGSLVVSWSPVLSRVLRRDVECGEGFRSRRQSSHSLHTHHVISTVDVNLKLSVKNGDRKKITAPLFVQQCLENRGRRLSREFSSSRSGTFDGPAGGTVSSGGTPKSSGAAVALGCSTRTDDGFEPQKSTSPHKEKGSNRKSPRHDGFEPHKEKFVETYDAFEKGVFLQAINEEDAESKRGSSPGGGPTQRLRGDEARQGSPARSSGGRGSLSIDTAAAEQENVQQVSLDKSLPYMQGGKTPAWMKAKPLRNEYLIGQIVELNDVAPPYNKMRGLVCNIIYENGIAGGFICAASILCRRRVVRTLSLFMLALAVKSDLFLYPHFRNITHFFKVRSLWFLEWYRCFLQGPSFLLCNFIIREHIIRVLRRTLRTPPPFQVSATTSFCWTMRAPGCCAWMPTTLRAKWRRSVSTTFPRVWWRRARPQYYNKIHQE